MLRALLGLSLGFHPFDDTYITFRYALNIATGHGFVYNWGEPILGTTSPLWAIVLAALHMLHVPLPGGAMAVSLLADTGTAVFIGATLRRLGFPVAAALGGAILFLCSFDNLALSLSGMETPIFILLVVAALHQAAGAMLRSACALTALACLTRPEGLALIPVLVSLPLLHRPRIGRADVLAGAGIFLAITGTWGVFAQIYFGSIVPQSVMAKASTAGSPDLVRFSWINLLLFFSRGQFGGALLQRTYVQLNAAWSLLSMIATAHLLATLVRKRDQPSARRVVILLLFPACFIGGLALSHAFTWFPWYYGPIYPFFAILTALGAGRVAESLPGMPDRTWRRAAPMIALLIAAQIVAALIIKIPRSDDFWLEGYRGAAEPVPRSESVRIAVPEIGIVGWKLWPARIIDLVGLVTPEAVGVPSDVVVRRLEPDYIVLRTDDAAPFLARVAAEDWFARDYERILAIRDPFVDREFHTYKRRSPSTGTSPESSASLANVASLLL